MGASETTPKAARNVRPGDIIFHQDYPAEVLHSAPCHDGEAQIIVWGYSAADMCIVPANAAVQIGGMFNAD